MNLDYLLFDNTLLIWLQALAIAASCFGLLWFIKCRVMIWLKKFAERTTTTWDDFFIGVATHTHLVILAAVSLWVGTHFLTLKPGMQTLAGNSLTLAVWLQIGLWIHGGTKLWRHAQEVRAHKGQENLSSGASILIFIIRVAAWSLCLLMAMSNMGINVTALITGLGIGGIAVALAMQNILGDLFASLTIALDKPFVIGDFVIVGDYMGTVEYVGLKTTRLRSLSGEQIICSNGDLLTSRIRNYKRMQERRIVFALGVTYDTPTATLARIPDMIKEVISQQPQLRLDRAHFKTFGPSSLDFEIVYYVPTPEFNDYMDAQQKINLALHERFGAEGIEFAFPTQTVHLFHQEAAKAPNP